MAAEGAGIRGRGLRARGTLGASAPAAGNGEERGRAGASSGRGSCCDGERVLGEGRWAGAGGGGGSGPRGGGPGSAFMPVRCPQDVFLMIRRHKTTIFTDAKESSTVYELKRIVEGILKRPPDEQRLYKVRPRWFRVGGGLARAGARGALCREPPPRAWP